MYQINDKYVNISHDDIDLTFDYLFSNYNNIDINQVKNKLELYKCDLNVSYKKYIQVEKDNSIVSYILEMYKDRLSLQMIQNSIMWSIIDIENAKKSELEFLYKSVVFQKLMNKCSWSNEKEKKLIRTLLKNNEELCNYIIYTQSLDEYMNDMDCELQIEKKLQKNLK